MTLNLTYSEIDALWNEGYRPFEIYVCNSEPVEYFGEPKKAGEVDGWDIRFVFAKRAELEKFYPFFDAIIGMDSIAACTEIFPTPRKEG